MDILHILFIAITVASGLIAIQLIGHITSCLYLNVEVDKPAILQYILVCITISAVNGTIVYNLF